MDAIELLAAPRKSSGMDTSQKSLEPEHISEELDTEPRQCELQTILEDLWKQVVLI